MRWEWVLVVFLIVVIIINSSISPYFLETRGLLDMTFHFMEKSIVALIMAVEESESETIKDTALSVFLDGIKKEVKC